MRTIRTQARPHISPARRRLLKGGVALAGVAAATPFTALLRNVGAQTRMAFSPDYGPLVPVADANTGLELLKLPRGFRYVSFGWRGDPLDDGSPTPPRHDGMAVVKTMGHKAALVRNHEVHGVGSPIGADRLVYDHGGPAGTTSLVFDMRDEQLERSEISLAGTSSSCAGGPTPWGSWLSCEETVADQRDGFERTHGWIFEVPANGAPSVEPLTAMGRFRHEAVAIDPATGVAYETEDHRPAGFYRFLPDSPGDLSRGGRLQMLAIAGAPNKDLRQGIQAGTELPVEWVDITDPTKVDSSAGSRDGRGVFSQGYARGGARFIRLEGCWFADGLVFFDSTIGGAAGEGQVWAYDPSTQTLTLVFVSPDASVLNNPDNITQSPRGGVLLCEDGGGVPGVSGERLQGLTRDGTLFPFAENNVVLNGEKNGFKGDFTREEWNGVSFSHDGRWLFANIQDPGISFAITGPWEDGGL